MPAAVAGLINIGAILAGSGPCGVWRGGSSASCCCGGWPTSGPIWWPRRCRGWAPAGRRRTPRTPAGRRCSTRRGRRAGWPCGRRSSGPPEELEDRRFGDLDVQVRRWPMPLWPHLYWEVLTGPGGSVLNEHLVRAPGSPVPPAAAGRLLVWEHTLDDVVGLPGADERRPRRRDALGGAPARAASGPSSCGGCCSRSAGHRRAERRARRPAAWRAARSPPRRRRGRAPAAGGRWPASAATAEPKTSSFTSRLTATICTGAVGAANTPQRTPATAGAPTARSSARGARAGHPAPVAERGQGRQLGRRTPPSARASSTPAPSSSSTL